jgi:hypothetical protein
MNMRFFLGIALIVWTLIGCDKARDEPKQRAIDAAVRSLEFAKKDAVDFSSYSITSIVRMRDGRQSIVRVNDEMSGFDKAVYEKLRGKKYWEVCYTVSSDLVLGAIYCYYFDDSDLKYIAEFRVK